MRESVKMGFPNAGLNPAVIFQGRWYRRWTMLTLTTTEVAVVAGIPPQTVHDWMRAAGLEPVANGYKGWGNSAEWTFLQAVAFTYAANIREAGGGMDDIVAVLNYISSMDEDELVHCCNNATLIMVNVPGQGARPISWARFRKEWPDLPEDPPPQLELGAVYDHVLEMLRSGELKWLKPPKNGRARRARAEEQRAMVDGRQMG
jgi:hypothetical protein